MILARCHQINVDRWNFHVSSAACFGFGPRTEQCMAYRQLVRVWVFVYVSLNVWKSIDSGSFNKARHRLKKINEMKNRTSLIENAPTADLN